MNALVRLLALATLATATASEAQYVKGNEAVKVLADGSRQVETPPLPKASVLAAPCKAENLACTPNGWVMVETAQGLQECTEYYARSSTCRTSTYGSEKRPRRWIVKAKGAWMQCPRPEITSACVSTKALPTIEIQ